jgi:large conductance mechanosensitive channel
VKNIGITRNHRPLVNLPLTHQSKSARNVESKPIRQFNYRTNKTVNSEEQTMGLIKEFRDFAMKGNVIDLAVGVVIGAAFGKIVSSLVSNIIMPPLNLLTAKYGVNFSDMAYKIKTEAPKLNADGTMVMKDGKPDMLVQDYPILNYGPFIQSVVDFLLVAAAIFVVIKLINTAKARFESQEEEKAVVAPEDVLLLREIRDSLKK